MGENFIEESSAVVHDKRLERNNDWAPDELKKSFGELTEEEKEKDRAQVKKASEIWKINNRIADEIDRRDKESRKKQLETVNEQRRYL